MEESTELEPPLSLAWRDWRSGVFVFSPYDEPTIGRAQLHGDVLGQVTAAITSWAPDGLGSADSDWRADVFLVVDLLESRLRGVVDQRADTGELSVELFVDLPEGTAAPWRALDDYGPAEVFSALASVAGKWDFQPATMKRLEQIFEGEPDDLEVALAALAAIGPWQPVEWDA